MQEDACTCSIMICLCFHSDKSNPLFLYIYDKFILWVIFCKVTVGALHHRGRYNSALHFCIISLEQFCQVLSAGWRVRFKICEFFVKLQNKTRWVFIQAPGKMKPFLSKPKVVNTFLFSRSLYFCAYNKTKKKKSKAFILRGKRAQAARNEQNVMYEGYSPN